MAVEVIALILSESVVNCLVSSLSYRDVVCTAQELRKVLNSNLRYEVFPCTCYF